MSGSDDSHPTGGWGKCDIKNVTSKMKHKKSDIKKCDMKKWDIQMKNVKESSTSTPK